MILNFRYNKLALDIITTDGTCMKLIDEIHTFVQAASHPIGNLLVKGVAMGTSHTAAVTGAFAYFSFLERKFSLS